MSTDLLSINSVAARLGLSVHQLRRWELMFGLEIKRGRGQQRQYRAEDLSVLERIKELVEQGWPTSQIRPQLEAEGLVTPKLIGLPPPPGNPEVLMEALIGFRNFTERRFIEISKQIDELRQLLISITLKQELQGETSSPWQPLQREFVPEVKPYPVQEIAIGPEISIGPAVDMSVPSAPAPSGPQYPMTPPQTVGPSGTTVIEPAGAAATSKSTPEMMGLGEITDQNYLTVLGRALDLVGWTDEQADNFSLKSFGIPHWDELGRSQAEVLIEHLLAELQQEFVTDDLS